MSLNKEIVITGGAGYIGSHLSLLLAQHGYRCIIIDRTITAFPDELAKLYNIQLVQGDCGDIHLMRYIFNTHHIDTVIHMAAYIEVGASVIDPYAYYENNCSTTLSLLSAMRAAKVNRFIFSSSCAVFGNPQNIPINEQHSRIPISPYGRTKYIVELMLEDAYRAYGLQAIAVRYFNAAGAAPQYKLGERHTPETHLIPRLLTAAYKGGNCTIFGTDYPTKDGTCIRDYVHVLDIAQAHLRALVLLQEDYEYGAFNIGTGIGYSVAEVIDMVEQVTGYRFVINHEQRRPGDPPILVADPTHALKTLRWQPHMSDLHTIVQTAHLFLQNFYKNL